MFRIGGTGGAGGAGPRRPGLGVLGSRNAVPRLEELEEGWELQAWGITGQSLSARSANTARVRGRGASHLWGAGGGVTTGLLEAQETEGHLHSCGHPDCKAGLGPRWP